MKDKKNWVTFFSGFIILFLILLLLYVKTHFFDAQRYMYGDIKWINIPRTFVTPILFLETPLITVLALRGIRAHSHIRKILRAAGITILYVVLVFIFTIGNQLFGASILGSVDCGGLDPGFSLDCGNHPNDLWGYKRTCVFFICNTSFSSLPN